MYSYLITFLICMALSAVALLHRSKISISFAFLCACFALWSLELFLLAKLENSQVLLIVFHILRVGMFFIPPALILFSAHITNTSGKWLKSSIYLSLLTALSLSAVNIFIYPSSLITDEQGLLPKPDLISFVFKINYVISVIFAILICILAYRRTIFTEKQRIAWIIMAYGMSAPFGIFAFNFSKLSGTLGTVIFLSLLAYAVFRYRLISTRLFASHLLAKSITGLSLIMGYILLNEYTVQNGIINQQQAIYSSALYMFCCFGLYNKLQNNFQPYTSSLLINNFYNLKNEQSEILQSLSHCLESKDLKKLLDDIFFRLIKVQDYKFYISTNRPNVFNELKLNENLVMDNEHYFNEYKELTYYEEVDHSKKTDFSRLQQSAFLPIIVNSKIIAMITMGQPQKKEQFALRDTQLLYWLGEKLTDRIPIILKYNKSMLELVQARTTLSMISIFNAYNHDVKAPLHNINALINSGDLFSTEEKNKNIIEQVEFGLNRINTMCNILNGRNNQQKQILDLNQSIKNIHQMFRVKLGISNLDLKPIPKVFAQKDMLEILLSNLYKNAIEASKEKAQITVKTFFSKKEEKIIFTFSDKGKGMSAEIIDKLFTTSLTTKKGGTGVGMSLVKNIINELNGTIDIKSIVDHGTTLTFKLTPRLTKIS